METAQPPWVSSVLNELKTITLPSLCALHQEVYGNQQDMGIMTMSDWKRVREYVENRKYLKFLD